MADYGLPCQIKWEGGTLLINGEVFVVEGHLVSNRCCPRKIGTPGTEGRVSFFEH